MSAVLAGLGIFAVVYLLLFAAVSLRFRHPRVIRCPESRDLVVVEVDSERLPRPVRVHACTHWPARAGCAQGCVRTGDAVRMGAPSGPRAS